MENKSLKTFLTENKVTNFMLAKWTSRTIRTIERWRMNDEAPGWVWYILEKRIEQQDN